MTLKTHNIINITMNKELCIFFLLGEHKRKYCFTYRYFKMLFVSSLLNDAFEASNNTGYK
jgi:hypothetical protein